MGCRCGGGGISRAVFGATRNTSPTVQPVLAGQARARRLAAMIEEQNKSFDQERREIQRKRQAQILKNMQKLQ